MATRAERDSRDAERYRQETADAADRIRRTPEIAFMVGKRREVNRAPAGDHYSYSFLLPVSEFAEQLALLLDRLGAEDRVQLLRALSSQMAKHDALLADALAGHPNSGPATDGASIQGAKTRGRS